MKRAAALLSLSSFLFALSFAADARPLPAWVKWGEETDGPHRYRISGFTFTTSVRRGAGGPAPMLDGGPAPILTIAAKGKHPIRVEGAGGGGGWASGAFLVFPVDEPRHPSVILFRSFSGGAHCCDEYKLIEPTARGWRVHELGAWDGFGPEPADVDRDGRLELVAGDLRFDYRLASHAESLFPPVVYKVRRGELVDVSTKPQYRPLFKRGLERARKACVESVSDIGSCLGYVAVAARAGEAKTAIAVLDGRPPEQEGSSWEVPVHCGGDASASACAHENPTRTFEKRHDAVVWFLTDIGYLPERSP